MKNFDGKTLTAVSKWNLQDTTQNVHFIKNFFYPRLPHQSRKIVHEPFRTLSTFAMQCCCSSSNMQAGLDFHSVESKGGNTIKGGNTRDTVLQTRVHFSRSDHECYLKNTTFPCR